ncbi:MAG: hypothetical protein JWR75_66 [Devosia sp.]|nr:hypothetical protein [Devosia sp.]
MTAAQRLAALDTLPADDLCRAADTALRQLVDVMNAETMMLRAGHYREATQLTASKSELAQDYVGIARSVQRQAARLKRDSPILFDRLRNGHESLAVQMAENLRVLATARAVSEDLLTDVAKVLGAQTRTRTYGASGSVQQPLSSAARGIAVNRAL